MKVSWREIDHWTQEISFDGITIGTVEKDSDEEWYMKPFFVYKARYYEFMKSGYESAYRAGKALVELYKASRDGDLDDTDEYNIESLFYFLNP